MIRIHIIRDNTGFIWEFKVVGHAGFSEQGSDIVCAAVSAVAYTALGALDEITNIKNFKEKDGFIKCSIPAGIAKSEECKVKTILDTMAIGFKQIEYAYRDYVEVFDEEV